MLKRRILAIVVFLLGLLAGYFVYASEYTHTSPLPRAEWMNKYKFKLGLDLSGGSHLVYRADVSAVPESEISDSMDSLRDVIERRVNLFGVSEPNVQLQKGGALSTDAHRLIVDLPGITDVQKAIDMIGQTPLLEFKTERPEGKDKEVLVQKMKDVQVQMQTTDGKNVPVEIEDPYYVNTELTGRYLKRANLQFNQNTGEPVVALEFNDQGSKLFAEITKANVGKTVAIYLDGSPISTPVVQQEITGGTAIITGKFTPQEAKTLVGRLNSGALPVPIELVSTQTIGPSLGEKAIDAGVKSALVGFIVISLFLILWYRLPGIVSVLALAIYVALMLTLFKFIPVTITAAGIAGFIISIGIAVDANILIAERTKEEIKKGKTVSESIKDGFDRAWSSIRDSNISHLLSAIILFWFGTTLIQGFALTLAIGVIVSLFSAITVTRIFLYALDVSDTSKVVRFLFSSGFSK